MVLWVSEVCSAWLSTVCCLGILFYQLCFISKDDLWVEHFVRGKLGFGYYRHGDKWHKPGMAS